ncbi:YiiD C-terminal domain-containing protein [Marinobacter fonticola]|uniref:YiiD C-terminal domain-containing protein n=1 Tax=Marinobacter fonticola TaxID=2603215 RepID=UPI0011E6324B|nr:YiiD C-terminal domain-containing protein [Marinobacter fonticola]
MAQLAQLKKRINEEIPLTRALGVTFSDYTGTSIIARAPLAPNYNHHGTGFGGSLYAVAVTAAWSLLELWLEERNLMGRVVIQSGTMDYGLPVSNDFHARCTLPPENDMLRFARSVERRGKGRVCLESTVFVDERGSAFPAATFSGRFVVLKSEQAMAGPGVGKTQ